MNSNLPLSATFPGNSGTQVLHHTNPMNRDPVSWKIAAEPASLMGEEFWARYGHFNMPEKCEAIEGKLFWNEEQRLHVLAMLLEALGLKRALELCSPKAIRDAISRSTGSGPPRGLLLAGGPPALHF